MVIPTNCKKKVPSFEVRDPTPCVTATMDHEFGGIGMVPEFDHFLVSCSKLERFTNSNAQCMVYLPTFGLNLW